MVELCGPAVHLLARGFDRLNEFSVTHRPFFCKAETQLPSHIVVVVVVVGAVNPGFTEKSEYATQARAIGRRLCRCGGTLGGVVP